MSKKVKTWKPEEIWQKHLNDLESNEECGHSFLNFTKEEKISYVKDMLFKIKQLTVI